MNTSTLYAELEQKAMQAVKTECVVFLDAGHGGLHPETGENQTPNRVHIFNPNIFKGHHNGYVYEGLLNRRIAVYTIDYLRYFGIMVIPVYDTWEDTPLADRVNMVNSASRVFRYWLTLSEHCNGSVDHNAYGFEAFTSPGETDSDRFATLLYTIIQELMPWLKLRTDFSEGGDPDKEAFFAMVTKTVGPACLIENNFYDHLKGVKMLFNENSIKMLAYAKALAVRKFFLEKYILK